MTEIKILLVDDDPNLRNMLKHVLEKQGCEVIAVEDGSYAITELERCGKEIDGIITDMDMPNKTGKDVIQHMVKEGIIVPTYFQTGEPQREEVQSVDCYHFVEVHDKLDGVGHITKFVRGLADRHTKKK